MDLYYSGERNLYCGENAIPIEHLKNKRFFPFPAVLMSYWYERRWRKVVGLYYSSFLTDDSYVNKGADPTEALNKRGKKNMDLYYSNLYSDRTAMDDALVKRPMKTFQNKKISVLASFYREAHAANLCRKPWVDKFMLDSGAFSAYNARGTINLNEYIEYCFKYKTMFDVIVSLDVIGDPEASVKNYHKMIRAGVDCIPVYHIGSDIKYLHKLAGETNYIGLGGIAGKRKEERNPFLNRVFEDFPDPKQVGFHGFGVGDEDLFVQYPWKSCDSSSMHISARFGIILTPWGRYCVASGISSRGAEIGQDRKKWATDVNVKKIKQYVEDMGADWEIACSVTPDGKKERAKISIMYLEELKKACPEMHRAVVAHFGF